MIFELEGKKFDADIEKTKEYYASNSLCVCPACRNFYISAKEKYLLLNAFLEKFGVDISRPDEISWGDLKDGQIDYIVVQYTVNGEILETDGYEIDITGDFSFVSIAADNSYVPSNQKTGDYFVLSVYGIILPYIIDEPFTTKEKIKKKFLDLFRKKKKQGKSG